MPIKLFEALKKILLKLCCLFNVFKRSVQQLNAVHMVFKKGYPFTALYGNCSYRSDPNFVFKKEAIMEKISYERRVQIQYDFICHILGHEKATSKKKTISDAH